MPTQRPYVYQVGGAKGAEDEYGTRAQANYEFLEELWKKDEDLRKELVELSEQSQNVSPQNVTEDADLRKNLLGYSQSGLKDLIREKLKTELGPNVSVVVVDLETAKMMPATPTQGVNGEFYIFFLPAYPRGRLDKSYIASQQWAEAWYHAVHETGGM
jgi:hypothetical protein